MEKIRTNVEKSERKHVPLTKNKQYKRCFFLPIYLCILYIIILIQKGILSNNARILKNHNC